MTNLTCRDEKIENKIRPLALGSTDQVGKGPYLRALFASSHEGGRRAAMLYSFFGSCREVGVDEREWLHDVLLRIGQHRIQELLPGQWAKE